MPWHYERSSPMTGPLSTATRIFVCVYNWHFVKVKPLGPVRI